MITGDRHHHARGALFGHPVIIVDALNEIFRVVNYIPPKSRNRVLPGVFLCQLMSLSRMELNRAPHPSNNPHIPFRNKVIVCFDQGGADAERKKLCPSYKSWRRSKQWSSVRSQRYSSTMVTACRKLCIKAGFTVLPEKGFTSAEADDLIATAVRHLKQRPRHRSSPIVIVSEDKDLLQCVSSKKKTYKQRANNCIVWRARRRQWISTNRAVEKAFGVSARDVASYLAQHGDPSDGIPKAKTPQQYKKNLRVTTLKDDMRLSRKMISMLRGRRPLPWPTLEYKRLARYAEANDLNLYRFRNAIAKSQQALALAVVE